MTALPRGGEIIVELSGTIEAPNFLLRCQGEKARPPQYLIDFIIGQHPPASMP